MVSSLDSLTRMRLSETYCDYMTSFNSRECRRAKIANIIEENFKSGDFFTVHDVVTLWKNKDKHSHELTTRELAKTLPIFELYSEKRVGISYKFYRYDGQKPLYTKRIRDED